MQVVIIEDETAAAMNLRLLLKEIEPNFEVVASLESVADSVEWFRNTSNSADLIFMDIHLADGDAFNIFLHTDVRIPIVFTTAYDQYALRAFEVNSIDYLLKPIKSNDLRRALDKFRFLTAHDRAQYIDRVSETAKGGVSGDTTFLLSVRDKIIPLKSSEIAFCYTFDERVTITTHSGATYPYDRSLDHLTTQLSSDDFFRANRQFIVARSAINDMSVWFGNRLSLNLKLTTPERIIISKARVKTLKLWLTNKS